MMTAPATDIATEEPAPEWGPKMAALPTDRQRRFVDGLFDAPKAKGRLIWAARVAGYGTATSSNKSLSVIASRLAADEHVREAIAEESHRRLRILAPSALAALSRLVDAPTHKDHGRALAMILDRTDPVETTHNVKVERVAPPSIAATEKVLTRIAELANSAGIPAQLMPPVIDAEIIEDTRS
jgi:phage terminase small subunit